LFPFFNDRFNIFFSGLAAQNCRSRLPQRDSPQAFSSAGERPSIGLATSYYAGSKPRAHHEIECFSATTVGRMWRYHDRGNWESLWR